MVCLGPVEPLDEVDPLPAILASCPHSAEAHPERPGVVAPGHVRLGPQLELDETRGEEDLGAGGPHGGIRLQRLHQGLQPARRHKGVAVDEGDVVHLAEVEQAEVGAPGKAEIAGAAPELHLREELGNAVGAAVGGGVVHDHYLEGTSGPLRRQHMGDGALDHHAPVEIDQDCTDAGGHSLTVACPRWSPRHASAYLRVELAAAGAARPLTSAAKRPPA